MNIKRAKAKLIQANFKIVDEALAPNGDSTRLILDSNDKVILENNGVYSVIGDNKNRIEAILSKPDVYDELKWIRKYLKRNFIELSKFIGSAAVGGVIGNRSDKQVDNYFLSDDEQNNKQESINKLHNTLPKDSRPPETINKERVVPPECTGTVKFYNEAKGFGFIKPDDGGEDVFVHADGLIDQIHENDKVEFEIVRGKKGLNAIKVRLNKSIRK